MLGRAGADGALLRRLERLSGGSPFWVLEAVRACVQASGTLDAVEVDALDGVEDPTTLIQARLRALDDVDRAPLELAATLGRRLDPELLRSLHGPLDAWLERMVDADVLRVQRGGWRLAHDAVRETVLARIAPPRRRQLHERAADALEQRGAPAAEIAHHLAEAGLPERALPVLLVAAEQALALGALAEAEAFASAVLDTTAHLTESQRSRAERCALEAAYAGGQMALALTRIQGMRDRWLELVGGRR